MSGNITFNGRTAVHAGSKGVLTTVDICGVPPFCTNVAFTNIAKSEDAADTSTTTFVNGNPICNAKSYFAVSSGDEAGTCGGVNSGTIKGKAEFLTFSSNIFDNGIPVVRAGDMMVSNNRNTPPAPLMQPGAGMPPNIADEGPTELEAAEKPFEVSGELPGDASHMLKSIIEFESDD